MQVSTDSEAMVEVVDNWLAKVYPKKPTWREIADAVETVGHHKLADSLRQVYITGEYDKVAYLRVMCMYIGRYYTSYWI